jgi:hypothetical protein
MKSRPHLIWLVMITSLSLVFFACSSENDSEKPKQKKLSAEQVTAFSNQIISDLDSIAAAADQYTNQQGEVPRSLKALKDYLDSSPKPPEDARDVTFKFEWNYYISNALGDIGGATDQRDTVILLEGVREQICFAFNNLVSAKGEMAWDYLGKKERPDNGSWCENGGNPYRIIRVISLQ